MSESTLAEARSHNVRPETLQKHYRTIRDAMSAHKDTGMAVARAKKSAKADGVDLDAFKLLQQLADLDTDEADMRLRNLVRYAKYIELPLGTQVDMFRDPATAAASDDAKAEQREWEAGDAGKKAGAAGHQREDNPHQAGSREHVAWDRSWSKAHKAWTAEQTKLAKDLGRNAGKANDEGKVNGAGNSRGAHGDSRKGHAAARAAAEDEAVLM
jgi:hypothetical protein